MNNVHEPGSRIMSENLTQEKYRVKPGQKQAECTECTAFGQPACPGREQAAQPALPRALRPPSSPAHLPPRAPAAPTGPYCVRAPAAHCLTPHASATCAPTRALRAQRLSSPLSQYKILYCGLIPAKLNTSVTIQVLYRDTAFPANCLQYNICIATHLPQSLKYNTHCNTLPTHFTLSCNTILSIARYFQPFKPPL